ncbi:MAG: Calx-beta protein, partial [Verrucomicrobiaceae bacterium]|nr:Calx-beta protein [Verrucomicrobiaceae bacterium]
NFARAMILRGKGVTLRNQIVAGATAEPLDPYIAGTKLTRSAWYRFDALVSSSFARVVVKHAASVKFGVFVLTDNDGGAGALTLVSEANAAGVGTESPVLQIYKDLRYYVCVETAGLFDISVHQPGQDNDFFDDAAVLVGNMDVVQGSTFNATNTDDTPAAATTAPAANLGAGVWYTWTPAFNGAAVVSTNFSYLFGSQGHDTVMAVYTGTTLANLVQVGASDDEGLGYNSRATFTAVSGTQYHIWVGTYGGTEDNGGNFSLEYFPASSVGEFQIYRSSSRISEQQGAGYQVEVRRLFAGTGVPSVTIATSNGTAIAGSDYAPFSTVLPFANAGGGDAAYLATVPVTALQDGVTEPDENFTLTLSAPTLGATVGGSKTMTIANDPAPVAPGFTTTTLTVKESAGTISIPLQRSSFQGEVQVQIAASTNGFQGARQDNDFYLANPTPTLTFHVGEGLHFLPLAVFNNAKADGTRYFTLNVSSLTPGAVIEGSDSLQVTIEDDEPVTFRPGYINSYFNSDLSGSVEAKVTGAGVLTGKLITAHGTFPFTGKLSATGGFVVRIGPPTKLRTLTLQLTSFINNSYFLTLGDGELGTEQNSITVASDFSTIDPCPQAGLYTVADGTSTFGNLSDPSSKLIQAVVASGRVDKLGNLTYTGRLFDGTAFVATGGVRPDGWGVASVGLYANQGRITFSSAMPTTPDVDGGCFIDLVRPGRANQTVELPGVNASVGSARIAIYTPPPPGTRILTVWNPAGAAKAVLTKGGYAVATTQTLNVSPTNVVTSSAPSIVPTLKLTLTSATGMFSGTVTPPGSISKPISGALLQTAGTSVGRGFFLNSGAPPNIGQLLLSGP